MSERRTFFVHIGTRKSGTTSLQASLTRSRQALAEQDMGFPFVDWPDHRVSLGDPLLRATGDATEAQEALSTLRNSVDRCRSTTESRLLATYEELAELDEERVRLFTGLFGDFDLRIVITCRHWGSALPSEWQQLVKERLTGSTFPEFLDAVQDGRGRDSELFRGRHDVVAIADRWARSVGRENVIIVPLPARMTDPDLLPRLICSLIEVDPESLTKPPRTMNSSLGYAAAETLRRVYLDQGDRIPDFVKHFRTFPYRKFMQRSLMQAGGAAARLPEEHRDWVEAEAHRTVAALLSGGHRIAGDLDDLIPTQWDPPTPPPSETEIATVATALAADLSLQLTAGATPPEDLGAPEHARRPTPAAGHPGPSRRKPRWRR